MVSILTKYLLQHKRVSIPHVGSFEIKMKNASLDVADKRILPPRFVTEFSDSDAVADHQLHYVTTLLNSDNKAAHSDLDLFGEKLKSKIEQEAFHWNGLGTLKKRTGRIVFEPEELPLTALSGVAADKVIREKASHTVLVGEREHTSEEMTERLQATDSTETSYIHTIGWIVLALAIIAIAYFLYTGAFSSLSSGSSWK